MSVSALRAALPHSIVSRLALRGTWSSSSVVAIDSDNAGRIGGAERRQRSSMAAAAGAGVAAGRQQQEEVPQASPALQHSKVLLATSE
jgi:hypothetical protein